MKNINVPKDIGIPISPSLSNLTQADVSSVKISFEKKRILRIAVYAVTVAAMISLIAKLLVALINLTNISFFEVVDLKFHSPALIT